MGVLCPRYRLGFVPLTSLCSADAHPRRTAAAVGGRQLSELLRAVHPELRCTAGFYQVQAKDIYNRKPVQAYAQQAYAVYEASFTRNRTYVPR